MALRFSDRPQLIYNSDYSDRQRSTVNEFNARFPQGARHIQTAPEAGATPVWICENNGEPFLSIYHRGAWQKLAGEIDNRTGTTTWRMIGESISQPSAWLPATRENVKP